MRSSFYVSVLLLLLICSFSYSAYSKQSVDIHTNTITTVAFSPDGKTLASGGLDRKIILWDVATNKPVKTLLGHSSYIYSVVYTPDGKYLISASGDKTIRFWNTATGEQTRKFEGHEASIMTLAISPNGKLLASGDAYGTIKLWDVETGKETKSISGERMILSLAFSPDGKMFADARGDSYVRLWDTKKGEEIKKFSNDNGVFITIAFSPDGKMIAGSVMPLKSNGLDKPLSLWNLSTGKEILGLEKTSSQGIHLALAFSKDNQKVFTLSPHSFINTWDLSNKSITNSEQLSGSFIQALALSPDGKIIAISGGSIDKPSLSLWDGVTKESLKYVIEEATQNVPNVSTDSPGTTNKGGGIGTGIGIGPGRGGVNTGGGGPGGGGGGDIDYNKTFRANEVTQKARIIFNPQPEYTLKAGFNQIEGVIRISAILSKEGIITGIRPVSDLPFGLADMAIRAAKRIQFTPAIKDDRKVSQYITLEYNFRMY